MNESNTEYEIQDMFRIYQRESYDGVHTGITNWLTFVDQEIIMMNKQHVTFVADINKDISSPIPFNSDTIKEIFKTNKNSDKSILSLNNMGLLKFYFEKNNIKSTYYISREN